MTLAKPTVTGGDFLDLRELTANGPVLAVFRIRAFEDPEMGDYGAYKVPVIADVLICSGPHRGEVHLSERFIGAPTNALRGVKNPKKGEQPQPPATQVGQELAVRVSLVEKKGSNPFVGLDIPSDVEFAAIAEVHANGAGWNAAPAPAPMQVAPPVTPAAPAAPVVPQQQPGAQPPWAPAPTAPQPVQVGTGASEEQPPW
jgi:hypothetical protein